MSTGDAIVLTGVRKSYGDVLAVDGVDLAVAPGELLTLLGPSGCGKSTLLRLIAGFEVPDAGRVELFGEDVAGVGPERRGVGLLFQHLALFPHLDVAGNVAYGLRGLGRAERRARVAELLELVDLPGSESRFPDQLSGGQAQRVALARALAPRPRVVLLDEPFSSLDTSLRASLRAEVRSILRAAGVTAVLVTHDQDEALSLGDRVGVMFDGRLARHGAPRDVYGEPRSAAVATFVGDANRVPGSPAGDGLVATELGPLPGEDGVALVRPEQVRLVAGGDAEVVDVEYYGHDQAVRVRLPSGLVVRARLGTERAFAPGDRVAVSVVSPA
jgi:ABC-type Fe3+/spermidine/putrescine transport system ATPase subunit